MGFDVAGKTGTTQVISLSGRAAAQETSELDLRDHGWFTFFAPSNGTPEVAGAVLAEHSEHGYLAAPIARHVMQTYLAKKAGLALPSFPRPPLLTKTTPETAQVVVSERVVAPVARPGEID